MNTHDMGRLKLFAELLGWTGVRYSPSSTQEGIRLVGYPPGTSGAFAVQAVPDYFTDWAAASELMFAYQVCVDFEPEGKYVAAGVAGKIKYATFYDEYTKEHFKLAACRSVVCAVQQYLLSQRALEASRSLTK